jgi:ABC-type histidine transport system ATPase subunit
VLGGNNVRGHAVRMRKTKKLMVRPKRCQPINKLPQTLGMVFQNPSCDRNGMIHLVV